VAVGRFVYSYFFSVIGNSFALQSGPDTDLITLSIKYAVLLRFFEWIK
jgi:hypothetical protein